MNGRQLVVQWIAGLAIILFFGIGAPPWLRRGVEQFIPGASARRQSAEAARRDSLAAKVLVARQATVDTLKPAPPDSLRATSPAAASPAVVPDSTVNAPADPPPSEIELRIARWLILIGVPLALLWNTWRWYRARLAGGADTG